MVKNYLLIYSEQFATEIELLCQKTKAPSNTLFQIRKSSSSVYANIREANYGQSKADMLSKFEIALKECSETEGWLRLLFNTNAIDEEIYKKHRNLCGRIRRLLIASCKTLKEKCAAARERIYFISLSAQAENFTMTEGHYFTSEGYFTSQSVYSAV